MILKDENFLHALLEDAQIKLNAESGASGDATPFALESMSKILLPELEEKTMHLVQEAKKIMRHSKRKVLKPSDIEAALKEIEHSNVNQVFGCHPYEYEKKTHEDSTHWILKNDNINLAQFFNKPISETPLKTTVQMHWALLNGEVPTVPENIMPPEEKVAHKKKEEDPTTVFLKPKEPAPPKKKINREHKREIPITQEVKDFYNKFLEI